MLFKNIITECQDFLKNANNSNCFAKKFNYSKFFEELRNANLFFEKDNHKEIISLQVCEAWNSILHCCKIVLEKLTNIVILNSKLNFDKNCFNRNHLLNVNIEGNFQINSEYLEFYLNEIYNIIKELIFTLEKMKSYLENNNDITSGSSTSGLSIALILVKLLIYNISFKKVDIIEKIQCSSLYCLSILFRLYKFEFSTNWDIVLFPESTKGLNFNSILEKKFILPDFFREKDMPFLIYFLFSPTTKTRVNTLLCIQSIFNAPILKYKNMIKLLSGSKSTQFQDTSAYSLLNNIIKLTKSLLMFSEIYLQENSQDNEINIILIKTISNIVSNTPPLFWKNHFLNSNKSFIYVLSSLLFTLLQDKKLIIPSLQLFSNILNSNKNSELDKNLIKTLFHASFREILNYNKKILLSVDKKKHFIYNIKELSQNKIQNIVIESINFFSKCMLLAPYLILDIDQEHNVLDGKKLKLNCFEFEIFLNILKHIIFNMNFIDKILYIKALKLFYILINYLREIWIGNNLIFSEGDFTLKDFHFELLKNYTFKPKDIDFNCNDRLYSKLINILISFIKYHFVKNWRIFLELTIFNGQNDSNSFNVLNLCGILDIFSTVNPLIIEQIYSSQKFRLTDSFIDLLLTSLDKKLGDKLFSCVMKNLLNYCGDFDWLKYSSFTTFQQFESFLINKFIFILESDISGNFKEAIILIINKAIIFISMYHEINNKVTLCSKNNSILLNLLEISYSKYIEKKVPKFTELSCLIDWKSVIYSYKSFISFQKNNYKFIGNNISEIIRSLGHISKLTPFNKNDIELLIWLINLFNKYIIEVPVNSLKSNKIKWNSIYAVGLLFKNYLFNNIICQVYSDAEFYDFIECFICLWKNICKIIETDSELIKVKLNALRSLSQYNINNINKFKIPYFLLLITWKTFNSLFEKNTYSRFIINDTQPDYYQRYDLLWKKYTTQLGDILCNDTENYISFQSDKLSEIEKKNILKHYESYKSKILQSKIIF